LQSLEPAHVDMEPRRTSISMDRWTSAIDKVTPRLRRRRNSMQINFIRSKSRLGRIRSSVSLLGDRDRYVKTADTFSFLRLPEEIRFQIYAALFDLMIPTALIVRDPAYFTSYPENTFPRILPGLCYANRQIYNECVPLILKSRHVLLPDLMACKVLTDFASRSSNILFAEGIRSLLFISYVNWQPFATHTVQKLLRRCPSLRHIRIEITPSACVRYDDGDESGSLSLKKKKYVSPRCTIRFSISLTVASTNSALPASGTSPSRLIYPVYSVVTS
jgi:hypothetical protein